MNMAVRDETVSGNMYPVTSAIYVRDPASDLQLTVMNDRPQAGTSLKDG